MNLSCPCGPGTVPESLMCDGHHLISGAFLGPKCQYLLHCCLVDRRVSLLMQMLSYRCLFPTHVGRVFKSRFGICWLYFFSTIEIKVWPFVELCNSQNY